MRGTVTGWLRDGPCAGAFVQIEAVDGTPAASVYFAVLDGRVVPMPRDEVSAELLNQARGRWRLYGRDGDEPVEGVWPYRLLAPAAQQDPGQPAHRARRAPRALADARRAGGPLRRHGADRRQPVADPAR